jgi:acyl-coenzyme A thioesterase PaaI-like protein
VRLQRDNFCFACGKENPRGLKMDIQIDADGARCSYKVPPDLQGWQGYTHGGIISTMLDEVMVWAAAGREIETVTAEMTVRFRNPLPTNHTVKVEARVTDERKRLVLAEARAFDQEKVYAEAQGKLFRVS